MITVCTFIALYNYGNDARLYIVRILHSNTVRIVGARFARN